VALARINESEERITSIFRIRRISELDEMKQLLTNLEWYEKLITSHLSAEI
jgi:hypothetical protein